MLQLLVQGEMKRWILQQVKTMKLKLLVLSLCLVTLFFPPSQHENLPIEPEKFENSRVNEDEPAQDTSVAKESKTEQKEDEHWRIEELNVSEEFPGILLLEQKGNQILSVHSSGFDESTALPMLDVDQKEKEVYGAATFTSFHSAPDISGSDVFDESIIVSDLLQRSDEGIGPLPFLSKSPRSEKVDETDDSDLPCGAWWKRRVVSLCAQVKDTSTFWSIFVAAVVMGLVILGQHWQQERWQVLHQRWHLNVGNEKSGKLLSRLKDVIVGGTRRRYITTSSTDR